MKRFNAFLDRYYSEANRNDAFVVYGYTVAQIMTYILKQCGDDLTGQNVMKQASSIKGLALDGLLPGITINTSATDFAPIEIRDELVGHTYKPLPARRQEIPKDGGKVRVLSIPAIRDRVVQGALKLILEPPIFEADFQPGSFGYRPKKTAHEAVERVPQAIVQHKTRVIDFDLRSYFDNIRHDRLLAKVAHAS